MTLQRNVPGSRVRGGRGYLLVDNRVSGGQLVEMPTLTCAHCGVVVVLNPQRTRPRGLCFKCNAYVCDNAGCNAECNPIQEGIELALSLPGQGPFIARDGEGQILFDAKLRDQRRIH